MKRHSLILVTSVIASVAMLFILWGCSCSSNSSKVPSQFVGKWADQINRNQRVEISIKKNGDYNLKIIETNKRNDMASYSGSVVAVNEDVIKLPSTCYLHGDAIVNVNSTFYLRSDGAFSRSEADLNRPYGYLVKLNDN